MDSKQLALIYLADEANKISMMCTKNVHSLEKAKTLKELERQIGVIFSAMREVAEEFKLDEQNVHKFAEDEFQRRSRER